MKVSEVMTKKVVSVSPDTKIADVAKVFYESGFHIVPVVEQETVVGVIGAADFITKGTEKVHIPSVIKILSELKIDEAIKRMDREKLKEITSAQARSIMCSDFVSVGLETSLTELIDLFEKEHVNSVPVVDSEKRLKGIISYSDLIRLISRFRDEEIDFLIEDKK